VADDEPSSPSDDDRPIWAIGSTKSPVVSHQRNKDMPDISEVAPPVEWPEFMPLTRDVVEADAYPADKMGLILGDMTKLVAKATQAPLAMCAQSVLAVGSLATQAHRNVVIDGRRHPLSGFFVTIGQSGERKSAVDAIATGPVRDYERGLIDKFCEEMVEFEADEAAYAEAKRKTLRDSNKRSASRLGGQEALLNLGLPPQRPLQPIVLCSEPTYEGLIKLLLVGQPSIGVFSDEGGRFVGGYGMRDENKLVMTAGLSELWQGNRVSRVRAHDDTYVLDGRRVSMHLMMQPEIGLKFIGDKMLRDQGFTSRLLCVWPKSTVGTRTYDSFDPYSDAAYSAFRTHVLDAMRTPPRFRISPNGNESKNELDPPDMMIGPDGFRLWVMFHNYVEKQMSGVFSDVRGFASKLAEHATRIAGIMQLFEGIDSAMVSLRNITNGIDIAEYYMKETIRLNESVRFSSTADEYMQLVSWASRFDHIHLAQVYQYGPQCVRNKTFALRALSVLEEHGYIVTVPGGAKIDGVKRQNVWLVRHCCVPKSD
jgi:hypothetical protein